MSEETKRCPDCQVEPGNRHISGCDVARCRSTGDQHLMCSGEEHEYNGRWYGEHEGPCETDRWTGEWPGVEFCRRMGWYTDRSFPGLQPGERMEDLNRLAYEQARGRIRWNPETEDLDIVGPVAVD